MNSKDKKLRDYMRLPYTVMLRRDEEGDFIARIKEFEGCVADGQDEMEAIGNLEQVKSLWIETALKAGQAVPMPDEDEELPSGKFLTRVPRSLHKSLVDIAEREGVSLNQLVTVALAEVAGRKAAVPATSVNLHASDYERHSVNAYGSGQGTSLRLVALNSSFSSGRERSGLLSESTVADVLSVQSGSSLPHGFFRKEA
jgi:predicted RNase H-like HicB family nuclease